MKLHAFKKFAPVLSAKKKFTRLLFIEISRSEEFKSAVLKKCDPQRVKHVCQCYCTKSTLPCAMSQLNCGAKEISCSHNILSRQFSANLGSLRNNAMDKKHFILLITVVVKNKERSTASFMNGEQLAIYRTWYFQTNA